MERQVGGVRGRLLRWWYRPSGAALGQSQRRWAPPGASGSSVSLKGKRSFPLALVGVAVCCGASPGGRRWRAALPVRPDRGTFPPGRLCGCSAPGLRPSGLCLSRPWQPMRAFRRGPRASCAAGAPRGRRRKPGCRGREQPRTRSLHTAGAAALSAPLWARAAVLQGQKHVMALRFPFGVQQLPVKVLTQSGEHGREISRNPENLSASVVRVARDAPPYVGRHVQRASAVTPLLGWRFLTEKLPRPKINFLS